MVNFQSENIVSIAPLNIVKIGIIETRENVILAFEDYNQKLAVGHEVSLNFIIARLQSLFYKLQLSLKRQLPEHDYLYVEDTLLHDNEYQIDTLSEIFMIMNKISEIFNFCYHSIFSKKINHIIKFFFSLFDRFF
jgi:hypothetical protein